MEPLIGHTARVALLAGALATAGCTRSPEPCATPGTCPRGEECLANRCVPFGGEPVSATSERRVSPPEEVAFVSSRAHRATEGVPDGMTLGSAAEGAAALYLNFAPIWAGAGTIEAAFLVLYPLAGTFGSTEDVPISVLRVSESWRPGEVSWVDQPAVAPPESAGIARGAPPAVLRVDVTPIVRYWMAHPRSAHGLALRARRGRAHGVTYASGVSDGRAPILEIYVKKRRSTG